MDIYIGLGVYQQKVVVFVDRFESHPYPRRSLANATSDGWSN